MDRQDMQKMGIRLLKKGHIGLVRLVFSRIGLLALLLLLQVALVLTAFILCQQYIPHLIIIQGIFVVVMVLYLINSDFDPSAKITWLVFIMIVPVFGTLFLLYTRMDVGHRALKARVRQLTKAARPVLPVTEADGALARSFPADAGIARYLRDSMGFHAYDRTAVRYFPLGDDFLPVLLADLEQARSFIFLEYFIIEEGEMWGAVADVLERKVREGVKVRVLCDGTCEFTKLHRSFLRELREKGIQCRLFAPIRPFISTHYNYRDHRKIAVVDGRVAYTGGVNLADEYINRAHPFGHWKDTAIRVEGEAARSFLLMFLQLWQVEERGVSFGPYLQQPVPSVSEAPGYVIPYGDCPLDNQPVGEWVYTHILNVARDYVHIMTPYLILDDKLENALKFAASRGVDVSIILPHIPDKKIPFALAKTHYRTLVESGVKIYEYVPGFLHAKSFVSDGLRGVVGTINLDYRSLSHHFECGAYLCGTPCIGDIEADFQETLKRCRRVTAQEAAHPGLYWRLVGTLMKPFAPLL